MTKYHKIANKYKFVDVIVINAELSVKRVSVSAVMR